MNKKKKIIIGAVSAAAALAVAVSGIAIWKINSDDKSGEKIFVSPVSEINTVNMSLNGECFSGVIESQKSLDVKYDTTKKIKEILVKEGDEVKEGTELFTYDVESMELELEQGNLEIEKFDNDIDSMEKQITQLESEKNNASSDEQFSYSTQIQTLKTNISKAEYDKKVKNAELEKLKNSIKNSAVKSEMSGTVKKVNSITDGGSNVPATDENGETTDADVVMTIIASGAFRVKGNVSEQNMMTLSVDTPVVVRSRTDSSVTWKGTVSEIGSEPVTDNNAMMYGETNEMTTASKYPFYVSLDNIDGLMLGQHVIVEPDYGQSGMTEKSGVWIYSDYLVTDDDGKTYVWASGKKDKLEKKYVEVGTNDETFGDCEITSGLSDEDKIAYPADDYEEGMQTTTEIDEAVSSDESADPDINGGNEEVIGEGEDIEGVDGGEDVIVDDKTAGDEGDYIPESEDEAIGDEQSEDNSDSVSEE